MKDFRPANRASNFLISAALAFESATFSRIFQFAVQFGPFPRFRINTNSSQVSYFERQQFLGRPNNRKGAANKSLLSAGRNV